MLRPLLLPPIFAAAAFLCSCDPAPSAKAPGGDAGALVPDAAGPAALAAWGFARHLPADVDLYVTGYHADEWVRSLAALAKPDENEDREKLDEAVAKVGDEWFFAIGSGFGNQLAASALTYREVHAKVSGLMAGRLLDMAAGKSDASPPSAEELLFYPELIDPWLDALEKDARLLVPSVVAGWKPGASELKASAAKVGSFLDDRFSGVEGAEAVTVRSGGCELRGYKVGGRALIGDHLEKLREGLAGTQAEESVKRIPVERLRRLVDALEAMELMVVAGEVDGRVVAYAGNGAQGLQLAEGPEKSLAASRDVAWTRDVKGRVLGQIHVSKALSGCLLPLMDPSAYWNKLAAALRPPVREIGPLRNLLEVQARLSHQLAQRDPAAWSAVVVEDRGWRLESRGGSPDPALDYTTPWTSTAGLAAINPAFRMQWVQNRARKDLGWQQVETLAAIGDAAVGELMAAEPALAAAKPELAGEVRRYVKEFNRAYREEFRAGIGDEVAVAGDLLGEIPAIPGIPQKTVSAGRMPRFLIARPVTDRARIERSGQSFARLWREVSVAVGRQLTFNLPAQMPQSIESDDRVTWYPPLPFIGGDFVPGVTVGDRWWMVSTSRDLVKRFATAQADPATGETGMLVELRFGPIREWITRMRELHGEDIERLSGQLDEAYANHVKADLPDGAAWMEQLPTLEGIRYRHWMEDGAPRTLLHLQRGTP